MGLSGYWGFPVVFGGDATVLKGPGDLLVAEGDVLKLLVAKHLAMDARDRGINKLNGVVLNFFAYTGGLKKAELPLGNILVGYEYIHEQWGALVDFLGDGYRLVMTLARWQATGRISGRSHFVMEAEDHDRAF